jgi:hypothetical protein
MKYILSIVLITLFSLVSNSQESSRLLLKLLEAQGPEQVIQVVTVFSDGSVNRIDSEGNTELINILSSNQISDIQASITAIQPAPLVRWDPSQMFRPGLAIREYMLATENGTLFTFAKNLRGVDFVLPDQQGFDLEDLLNSLAGL